MIKQKWIGRILLLLLSTTGIYKQSEMIVHAETEIQSDYYYQQLSEESKKIYDAIVQMEEEGLLKSGSGEYDLVKNHVLSEDQLATFATDSKIMTDFGAARDAYTLDHPEIFYVDFSYLSIRVGIQRGTYVATLGTGRAENYYVADGFTNEADVNAAVFQFNKNIADLIKGAEQVSDDFEKVRFINQLLIDKITYSFCSSYDNGQTIYLPEAAYIHSAYGALVNGKAVCEGYAKAMKVLLDKLQIPCVLVSGYAQGLEANGYEPHMWNAVKLDGHWYGIDVTWNDGEGLHPEGYFLLGNANMQKEHIEDGVISESGYRFRYPVLHPYDFGINEEVNGLRIQGEYQNSTDDGNGVTFLYLTVSYQGKTAGMLQTEGYYLSYRYIYEENEEPAFSQWMVLDSSNSTDEVDGTHLFGINTYIQYVQFAVMDYAPDDAPFGSENYMMYNPENLTDFHIKAMSEPFGNDAYQTYKAPPYLKSSNPTINTPLSVNKTYQMVICYTENLKCKDPSEPVDVTFVSQHADIKEYATVENVKWDENQPNQLCFDFTPSQMYQHRYESYSFFPLNLVGEKSGKIPNCFTYLTEQPNVICNKIFNDGRLYMKVYGEPALISSADLSAQDFLDEDGNHFAQNQLSQMMLVVNQTTETTTNQMLDSIDEPILTAETYDLQLNICSKIVSIPQGSFLQLAFGFPERYGPEDEGVTFKVYHFKKDPNGKIDPMQTEELDCVITPYGLIVTVTDFSPFAVVAVADDESIQSKKIYSRVIGYGGTIENLPICQLNPSETIQYQFLPDADYQVSRIVLNGTEIDDPSSKLLLLYDDLSANNTLEVYFSSKRIANYERENDILALYPPMIVKEVTFPSTFRPVFSIWVYLLFGILLILALTIGITYLVREKKRQN